MPSCRQYNVFDFIPRPKLLLECYKLVCKCSAVLLRNILECILKEDLGTIIFPLSNLKLRELDEEFFIESSSTQFSEASFEKEACICVIPLMLFKVGSLDKGCSHWICVDKSLQD